MHGICLCSSSSYSLGLQTIAEGVERVEQLDFLRSENCQLYQGFLFSEPLPLEAFRGVLSNALTRDPA